MTARSSRATVRNPVLALPAAALLLALPPESKAALRAVLIDLRDDCRARAKKAWDTHKPPMAAYWAVVGVWCNHIQRVLK